MSWIEWLVLAAGLAVGYGIVSLVLGERQARRQRAAARDRTTRPGEPGGGHRAPD